MNLFDKGINREPSVLRNIPRYERLNESAGNRWNNIRELLEYWFNHFPDGEDKKDLRERFKSTDDRQHLSALFELYLHEVFYKLGHEIEPHPELKGCNNNPDFKISSDDSFFFLEATSSNLSDEEISYNKNIEKLYKYLEENLAISKGQIIPIITKKSKSNPKPSVFKRFIKNKISEYKGEKSSYLGKKKNKGWEIEFCVVPKESRNGSLIKNEIKSFVFKGLGGFYGIKNKLKEKGSKYGISGSPYIVAVNIWNEWPIEELFVRLELFGNYFQKRKNSFKAKKEENKNGFFYGLNGPKHKNVNAVIIADNLNPWNLATETPTLWHNPWAKNKIDKKLWPFHRKIPDLNSLKIRKEENMHNRDLFNLNQKWPEGK